MKTSYTDSDGFTVCPTHAMTGRGPCPLCGMASAARHVGEARRQLIEIFGREDGILAFIGLTYGVSPEKLCSYVVRSLPKPTPDAADQLRDLVIAAARQAGRGEGSEHLADVAAAMLEAGVPFVVTVSMEGNDTKPRRRLRVTYEGIEFKAAHSDLGDLWITFVDNTGTRRSIVL